MRKKCTFFDDPRRHSSPSDVAVSSDDTFLCLEDLARFGCTVKKVNVKNCHGINIMFTHESINILSG